MLHQVIDLGEFAELECWLHAPSREMPDRTLRPALVIVPGGAYGNVSDRECDPAASMFFSKGYHTFILRYAVREHAKGGRPIINIAQAISTIRRHANEWGVIPQSIAACGFSAGGHLATAGALFSNDKELLSKAKCHQGENEINALILCYPVITSGQFAHRQSFENLGSIHSDDEIALKYSLEHRVTSNMPPVFVWHTVADTLVPVENSLLLISALRQHGIPFEAHLFEEGAHGESVCTAEVGRAGSTCAPWFDMAIHWLSRRFAFPV